MKSRDKVISMVILSKKLAVIVPVYNQELYIRECIESICAQTYENIIIVLVDDGSTDSSGNICDEYAKTDERITVIHQENQGVLKSRYNGLLAYNCEYATFVDADDWIDCDTYELASASMEKGIDVIAFGRIIEKGKKGRIIPKSNYEIGEYNRTDIENRIYPTMIWDTKKNASGITQALWDKIIKRDFLLRSYDLAKDVGRIHYAEDSLILFPIMQWIQSMCILENNSYHYRMLSDDTPSYMRNDDYFEKLYLWYKHIVNHVTEIPNVKKQIEYMYIFMAESRKRYYGDISVKEEYMFPFGVVSAGAGIVLWGAGKVGKIYYEQIKRTNFCNIVAWVDSNYQIYSEYGVQSIDIIKSDYVFDYVVIAVISETAKNSIISELSNRGVPEEKIIWCIE